MKRPPANLPESLSHRLNAYARAASAAGVSLLALAQPAEGKIVYTKAHVVIPANQVYNLDLNHDGKIDFTLSNNSTGTSLGTHRDLQVLHPKSNHLWQSGRYATSAAALPAGFLIRPSEKFGARASLMAHIFSESICSGNWANVKNRYLGMKFLIMRNYHFGWARLSVACSKDGISPTLTGYAYETIPNKPIIAGKTHGKDVITLQDPSLGHLARGASAIPAWRAKQ